MDLRVMLILAQFIWLLIAASKWGKEQFSHSFRLTIGLTLLMIGVLSCISYYN